MKIVYIRGEDNTVADALSRVPPGTFADEQECDLFKIWASLVSAILSLATDSSVLNEIKAGYTTDKFCKQIIESGVTVPGVQHSNGLWYIGSRLLIPRMGALRENLFCLAHDSTGHFGADKSYAMLKDDYYWPNMHRDLQESYVPGCIECQRNKSSTKWLAGPLYPLPIPDWRGDSVALDFIGPLPLDEGFDCILTMTDQLGNADLCIVPTQIDISAEDLALTFFNNWYCENGLPLQIISDHDKLFTSCFWKVLHALTGIKLKMSSAYHLQTDGSSKRSNKTVNQAICYHV